MASKKHGVRTLEWHKHLRNRYDTKRPQERLVRQDAKKIIKEESHYVRGYN